MKNAVSKNRYLVSALARVTLFIVLLLPALCWSAENRIALVIGNSDYIESPLKNPVNDAQDISEVLASFNFDVTLLVDADKYEMQDAISQHLDKLNDNTVGLFYFAGHGVQYEKDNYLIPVDVDARGESMPNIIRKSESVRDILRFMNDAGGLNLVMLDACRNEAFADTESFRSVERGLARVGSSGVDTYVMYATQAGEYAADGKGRNGLFTGELLSVISEDATVKIEDLFKETQLRVKQKSGDRQVPWADGNIIGDFQFKTKAERSEVQASPAGQPSEQSQIWNYVVNQNDLESYEIFLRNFPTGFYAEMAKKKVREIKEEIVLAKERTNRENEARRVAEVKATKEANLKQAQTLISDIKKNLNAYQLTSPENNNANTRLNELALLDPQNSYIQTGRSRIIELYSGLAEKALSTKNYSKVESYIASLSQVSNSEASVKHLTALLNQTKLDEEQEAARAEEQSARLAEQRRQAKARTQAQAEKLEASKRVEVSNLISLTENSLKALKLTTPESDNANEYLDQIEKLDPSNKFIATGRQRIRDHYSAWAKKRIEKHNLFGAKIYIRALSKVPGSETEVKKLNESVDDAKNGRIALVNPLAPEVDTAETSDDGGRVPSSKNSPDAFKLYVDCDGGSIASCGKLGLAYRNGDDVEKNLNHALHYLDLNCDNKDKHGCALAGHIYRGGASDEDDSDEASVTTDNTKAFVYFTKACDLKNFDSCNMVGSFYEVGLGTKMNLSKALAFYTKSCLGDASEGGCAGLGSLYFSGKGVDINRRKAFQLYEKGCAADDPRSCAGLSSLYKIGSGVFKNNSKRAEYKKKACSLGHDESCK